ncbi:MAG: sigma-70 family RNA polymerase sigma factor [Pirellulales bacterium]
MDASLSPLPKDEPSGASGQMDQWLHRARGGSPSALGLALEAGRNYLLLVANRALDDKLRAKVGASDLVQDTYLEAQRDFGQFRGETEAEFYRWLLGILAHRLANSVRHYRYTKRRDIGRELPAASVDEALSRIEDAAATPGAAFFKLEEQRHVRLALARMDERMRDVLIERTWHGDSFAEIAARRGCTAEAARKMWTRAVRQMRKLLSEIE